MRSSVRCIVAASVALLSTVAIASDKYLWAELIAFDNGLPDYGVAEYMSRMEVKPKGISLLLFDPELFHSHTDLKADFPIGDLHCSYYARPFNEERRRQKWTAHQLRGLVSELRRHGIESYPSFFDMTPSAASPLLARFDATRKPKTWMDEHRELRYQLRNGKFSNNICPVKRFADGSYYEDFFARQMVRFLRDYGFAGFHGADGFGHPRFSLNEADFSEDIIDQFLKRCPSLAIPEGTCEARAEWIMANARAKWCRFYAQRHAEFLGKTAQALKAEGKKLIINTSWTKDPQEALFRYGEDYRLLEKAGVDGFFAEASVTVLELEGWRYADISVMDRCRAAFMLTAASVDVPTIHLACIKDGMEQYNSLRHAPARVQAEVLGLENLFRGDRKAYGDVFWCLTDGYAKEEWMRLDWMWKLSPAPKRADGVRVVWSDKAADAEFDAYCDERYPFSVMLLARLLKAGASVSSAVNVDEALSDATMPLLILNPGRFPNSELSALRNRKAPVVEFGYGNPLCKFGENLWKTSADGIDAEGWRKELPSRQLPEDAYLEAAARINGLAPVCPAEGMKDLRISSYVAEDGSRIVVALNDRPTYLEAIFEVKVPAGRITELTDGLSLPIASERCEGGHTKVKVKIPPAGVVVCRAEMSR